MSDTPVLDWKLIMPKAMFEAWKASSLDDPAQWAWGEICRLREFEAREAVVANTIVCFLEVAHQPNEASFDKLVNHLNSFDGQLAQAAEVLGKRDKIRTAEGELRALQRAQAAFEHPDLNVDAYFDIEIGRLRRDLAEARKP